MPFKSLSYSFSEESIAAHAPAGPGVYGIHNSQKWIYVGEAGDIRAGLLRHLRGDDSCIALMGPHGFAFEECPAGLNGGRTQALILELQPVCNRGAG